NAFHMCIDVPPVGDPVVTCAFAWGNVVPGLSAEVSGVDLRTGESGGGRLYMTGRIFNGAPGIPVVADRTDLLLAKADAATGLPSGPNTYAVRWGAPLGAGHFSGRGLKTAAPAGAASDAFVISSIARPVNNPADYDVDGLLVAFDPTGMSVVSTV